MSLSDQAKEAKELVKDLKQKVDKTVMDLEEIIKIAKEKDDKQLTCEEAFTMADPFINNTFPEGSEVDKIQKDYAKCTEAYEETEKKILELEGEMKAKEMMMNELCGGKLSQEDFTGYYEVVRDLHLLMGHHVALLNRRAASAVVFLDKLGLHKN